MNKRELKAEMMRKGFSYKRMAESLKISENAFWRKINGANDFTLPEIQIIIKSLDLTDAKMKEIFFN